MFITLLLWDAALAIFLVQDLPSHGIRFWVVMLLMQLAAVSGGAGRGLLVFPAKSG